MHDSGPSTATYATTGLTMAKSVAESFYTAEDDTLNYSYVVSNNGSAPLVGPVVISDDRSTDESCPDVSTVGDFDAFLDPDESITCTATYTITGGDVTAGSVTNIASATVDGVTSNQDDQTVFINLPDLQVSKANNNSGSGPVGVAFNWTLTVSNAGPVDAAFADTQTIVSDSLPSGATYGLPAAGNFTDITNSSNISCAIDVSNVLTCDASGATVTIGATTGSFTVHLAHITARAFGETLRPHAFRHIAATSIAEEDPVHVNITASLLGHATLAMSAKHYNRATGAKAAASYQDMVRGRRREARRRARSRRYIGGDGRPPGVAD